MPGWTPVVDQRASDTLIGASGGNLHAPDEWVSLPELAAIGEVLVRTVLLLDDPEGPELLLEPDATYSAGGSGPGTITPSMGPEDSCTRAESPS
jgi:hypothetical protein